MVPAWQCAAAFGGAAITALVLTPLVRWLAVRLRMHDEPDGLRKLHGRPVPLMGGLAVYLALFGTLAVICLIRASSWTAWLAQLDQWWPIAIAATIVCFIGILDDVVDLRAMTKLVGQITVASVVYLGGVRIERIELLGWTWDLGMTAYPFTIFWLLGSMNSLNLLDGMDGLASGIGAIMSGCIAVVAVVTGAGHAALVAATLAGSLVGFLVYNFPPASIFLGDCGSMLIGLVLGAIAIESSLKAPATVAMVTPVAVLTIPILDSCVAILRRWYSGLPFHAADREHIHHRLQAAGLDRIQTLACLCGLTLLAGGGVLVSLYLRNEWIAVTVSAAIVVGLAVSRVFGHLEFNLLREQLRTTTAALAHGMSARGAVLVRTRTRLAECRRLDEAWGVFRRAADDLQAEHTEIDQAPERAADAPVRWCLSLALDGSERISASIRKEPGESTRAMLRRLTTMSAVMEEFRRRHTKLRQKEPALIRLRPSAEQRGAVLREAS